MELQQSSLYAKYIEALKWTVIKTDGVQMFYKHIPFTGGILKIQRPKKLPPISMLVPIIHRYKISSIAIEPDQKQNLTTYKTWCEKLGKICRVSRSNFLPTKTILVYLTVPEQKMFERFSEAKRRSVRKAQKNGLVAKESNNISDLIHIKNKSGGFFGFITTFGIDKLWPIMSPDHATIVLAHTAKNKLVGGIFLLFWNKIAYYWIAGATHEGKKLFAPTLLVWEALRIAKKRGCTQFDFVGVWDERKPSEHHDWKGFTKFKEGFGGKTIYYPLLLT
jgi:lipid II:glycine glycyltransferase (peptidoglycan interpeptide bridge formation enzyme)